jgi:uncharacterized membrane protein (DUF106 family)
LSLIWGGLLSVIGVLVHRIRRGAWTEQAFDAIPAISRWSVLAVAVAVLAVIVGTVLFVLSRL